MKRITIVLFFVGLLLQFAAFFGDQATNIPFVLKLVAPRYTQAQSGIQTLSSKKTLQPNDPGFAVISEIFLERLRELNSPNDVSKITIQQFALGEARLHLSTNRTREVIPINATLSNGQTMKWNLASLVQKVDELQNKNLFGYRLVVFLIGAVIQCIAFFYQRRERKRPKKIPEL